MTNIAIFVSGNGTNCENIIRYFHNSADINVSLVLSNKPDAYALVRATGLGVKCKTLTRDEINTPEKILPVLRENGIKFIVLAGFMMMIPDFLINKYQNRIINIHPSLLPKYGGKGMFGHHVHKAVKAAGDSETGITIHYVTPVCDGGEIIARFKTAVSKDDTAEDIENKVHLLEQKHFPETIEKTITALSLHIL